MNWTRRQMVAASGALIGLGSLPGCAGTRARAQAAGQLIFLSMNGVHRFDSATGQVTDLLMRSASWAGARGVFDGIDIDPANGHIYFSDMGEMQARDGAVYRCDLDGGNVTTIVAPGGTMTPKQLKLDLGNGHIYWSDREGMAVQRCNLDGSALTTLVTTGDPVTNVNDQSRWCVGMAIDPAGGHIYWSQKGGDNAGEGVIRRCSMRMPDGANAESRDDIETLFSGLPEPIDLDLDLSRRTLYWTDRGDNTVSRAPMDGGTREILLSGLQEAIGMALDPGAGRMAFTSLGGELGTSATDGSGAEIHRLAIRPLTGVVWAR